MTQPHGVGVLYFSRNVETAVSPHCSVSVTMTERLYRGARSLSLLFRDLHELVFGNAGMWKFQLAITRREIRQPITFEEV
jgi:hypothetical protein